MAASTTITVPVTFTYRSSTAQKVQVAGDWDQWSGRVDLNKVAGVQEDGQDLWQATQRVPPQTKLQYKYILNGDDWHTRDDLPTETDANGNKNNFLTSPEKEHAATDEEHKEKTTAEVVGAGITSTVGAAIATVVGTDPFAGHDQAIKSDAGLTASANGKVTSDAEKQSAVLDSGAGAPAGAAAAGASGPVPTEQLSKLGLADGKTPADAGAAAITAAVAGTTGAVAAGQSTGEGAIHPSTLETVQKSGTSTAVPAGAQQTQQQAQQTQQQAQQTQQQGVLDQDEASKGLAAGASGDAPTVGAPANGSTSQKANETAKSVAAGAAGVGAAVAGGAAAAAATASEKAKEAKETVQQKATSNGDSNASSTGAGVGAGSAATAAAGGTAAAASQQKAKPTETEKKQEQLSSGPTSTASKHPVAAAPAAAPSTSSSSNVAKDASAAAAGGAGIAATSAAAPNSQPKLTETEAKQEKLSSGPTAAPSKDPVVPSKDIAATPSSTATPASTTAAVAAGGAAAAGIGAGAVATGASKAQPAKPTETQLKQEQLSSGPVAAGSTTPVAAPALNQQSQQQQTSAPATPAKTSTAPATPAAAAATSTTPASASDYSSNTAKRGSRFGTSRKSKVAPSGTTTPPTNGANEFGTSSNAASSVDPNTFPTTSTDSQVERKSLERSRKKSGFFTRIKEKLGSPAKGKE